MCTAGSNGLGSMASGGTPIRSTTAPATHLPGGANPYTPGTLTLREPGVATFDGPAGTVDFTRTDIVDVPYECE